MKKIILSIFVLSLNLYAAVNLATCKGCHGQNFEKKAFGASRIVANMTKSQIVTSLLGFKAKTYNRPMKAVMEDQVSKYTIEELKNVGIGK